MNYTILRNNTQFVVNLWNLRNNDLVLSQDGYFYPVYIFSELEKYFPKPTPTFSETLVAIGGTILVTAGIIGIGNALAELFQPQYNSEPLTQNIRNYIRDRDDEICLYCEEYASNGHVDHRISRYNGGSNNLDNLTWACVFCNCSKGSMNDTEYIKLLELYS